MVKQGHLKVLSIGFVVLGAFVANLLLAACSSGASSGSNTSPTVSSFTPTAVQSQSNFSLPDWWRPCLKRDGSGTCTNWDTTKNPAHCDSYNNPQANPTPLAIWGGLEVCEPLVGKSNLVPVNFSYPASSTENEFQCTELVKRYLLLKDSTLLSLGNTNGDEVVNKYTEIYSMWHKVVNNDSSSNLYSGNVQMVPDVGDILSYGPTPLNSAGHTSIVVGANMTTPGNGTLTVIQQNIYWNHVAVPIEALNVINWVIQPSSHGAGSVISWMTTRPVSPQPQPSTPTPSPSPSALFTSGTWQGQGTYNNGQSPFDMVLNITVNSDNTFSGTLQETTYNSIVAINGSITSSSANSVSIMFTDNATVSGGQIQLNCTYTATVSNGQMTGAWVYPGDTSPDGTLSLSQTG